ncbi:unnamed protein product [Miscanthus lutarioriparius]|uniref:Serine protease n=1 Tax=Miscanthus lutarioriparius TaxID=422564 RepID=A0A811P5X2_9POAL|nr:unnamed protein product [Miscanthus lutarioriparius]
MANTPPRQQDAFSGSGHFSARCPHSASVVLVRHHHVASEQLLRRHGTGFIVWSSAEDYLVLTANHVITLEEHEMNDEVEIVVKMPGSGDYLPATLLRSDTSRDIALLRVTNNDDKSKIARRPLTFDDRLPPPVGTVVVLLGYFAPDGDVQMPLKVLPRMRLLWILIKGLMRRSRQTVLQLKVVQGHRPLIAEHKVVGLLTSAVHSVDVYRTVPTLKAVFQLWLLVEETDQRTVNDLIPLLAALEAQ